MTLTFEHKAEGQSHILFPMVDYVGAQFTFTSYDQMLVRYCDLNAFAL